MKDRCLKIPAKHASPWLWRLLTHRMLPLPLIVAFGCVLEKWLNRFKCSASQIVDTCLRLTMKAWTVDCRTEICIGLAFENVFLRTSCTLHILSFPSFVSFRPTPNAVCFDFCNLYVTADNKINEWTLRWHAAAMVMNELEWDDDVENLGVLIWCEQHRIRFQLVIRERRLPSIWFRKARFSCARVTRRPRNVKINVSPLGIHSTSYR